MILAYIKNSKTIPNTTTELLVDNLTKAHILPKCPNCNSEHNVNIHCIYERKICTIENKKIVTKPITVQRIICKSCDRTHAILPEDVIPYSHYGKKIIIYCLYEYYINKKTLSEISEMTNICLKIIYRFKKIYLEEYLSILVFLKSQLTNEVFKAEKYIIKYLYKLEFLGQFLLSYFQNTKKVIFLKNRRNIITKKISIGYMKCKNIVST